MTGCTGTMAYMAPEVALKKPYNEKVDVYSFGIILWQMISGETPFEDFSREDFMHEVVAGGIRPSLAALRMKKVPNGLLQLLNSCWQEKSSRRPSFGEIVRSLSLLIDEVNQPQRSLRGSSASRSPRQASILTVISRICHSGRIHTNTNFNEEAPATPKGAKSPLPTLRVTPRRRHSIAALRA